MATSVKTTTKTQATDSELVERYTRGQRCALETLIERYQARAYRYAFRLTRNVERSVELVTEAFLKSSQRVKSFGPCDSFSLWLYQALTEGYLSLRRGELSEAESVRPYDQESESPEEFLNRLERDAAVHEKVAQLPEYEHAMLTLFHAEMLCYTEISEILEIPIFEVKGRLNQARREVANVFEGQIDRFERDLAVA